MFFFFIFGSCTERSAQEERAKLVSEDKRETIQRDQHFSVSLFPVSKENEVHVVL